MVDHLEPEFVDANCVLLSKGEDVKIGSAGQRPEAIQLSSQSPQCPGTTIPVILSTPVAHHG